MIFHGLRTKYHAKYAPKSAQRMPFILNQYLPSQLVRMMVGRAQTRAKSSMFMAVTALMAPSHVRRNISAMPTKPPARLISELTVVTVRSSLPPITTSA